MTVYDAILVVSTKTIANELQKFVKETVKVVCFGEALVGIGCKEYIILSQPASYDSELEWVYRRAWMKNSLENRVVKR